MADLKVPREISECSEEQSLKITKLGSRYIFCGGSYIICRGQYWEKTWGSCLKAGKRAVSLFCQLCSLYTQVVMFSICYLILCSLGHEDVCRTNPDPHRHPGNTQDFVYRAHTKPHSSHAPAQGPAKAEEWQLSLRGTGKQAAKSLSQGNG